MQKYQFTPLIIIRISLFIYCCKAEEKKGDEKKLVTTAVLSTTVKAKARVARKEAKKHG